MNHRTSPAPRFLCALLSFLLASVQVPHVTAQQPTSSPPTPQRSAPPPAPTPQDARTPIDADDDDDEVVQIKTNLVQVDATVTDRDGRQVTDLRAEDFEILENGTPQPITNFSYVSLVSPASVADASVADASVAAPPPTSSRVTTNVPNVPRASLRPEQVRRTIALVVDDLNMSAESMHFVRGALRKYVDEQVQPGDLVAVIRTRAGSGALQRFTSDKRQLYAAIANLRWYPNGRAGLDATTPINLLDTEMRRREGEGVDRDRSQDANERRDENLSVGTLGALNYVVRGMRELPGRKAVVMMSDGLPILDREGLSQRIVQQLNAITDFANRSSIVLYTIHSIGLQTFGFTAADEFGPRPDQNGNLFRDRSRAAFGAQDGLNYLAQRTGGFMIRNTNSIGGGIRRVLDDQNGYYLIGYRPDERTFDPVTGRRRFNDLIVRLRNRSGLKVRTRVGFYGVTDEDARPAPPRTRVEQLRAALLSPFGASDINLRLTSLFFANEDERGAPYMRSLLHIDASNVTFTIEPDGRRKAVLDIVAVTSDADGRIVEQIEGTRTIRAPADAQERLLKTGFAYSLDVPVKRAGAYQLRIAVRDQASERTGSASQFVEVPNLAEKRLALSGLVVSGSEDTPRPAPVATAAGRPSEAESVADLQSSPFVRRFRQGATLDYGFVVYNAQIDRATNRPQLRSQARIFRDGREVYAGQPRPFDPSNETNMERLGVSGRLQLGAVLTPGEYILEIIVTDALAKKQPRVITRLTDFEIIR